MKYRALGSALVLAAAAMGAVAAPAAQAAPPGCGIDLGADRVRSAVDSVPRVPEGWPWSHNPRAFEGNYDPCATLSAVIVTVEGATGSSPEQALLFHKGDYVGTGTAKAYPFTSMNRDRTTDDTLALDYKDGRNACTACAGPVTTVRYQWQRDHVEMLDPPPPW